MAYELPMKSEPYSLLSDFQHLDQQDYGLL